MQVIIPPSYPTIIESFEYCKKNLKAMGLDASYKSSGAGDITNTSNVNYIYVISDVRSKYKIKSPQDVSRVDFSFNYRIGSGGLRCIVVVDISSPLTAPFSYTVMDCSAPTLVATDKYPVAGYFMVKGTSINHEVILAMKVLSGTNGQSVTISNARLMINKAELN